MDRILKCVGICCFLVGLANTETCRARECRPCRPMRLRCFQRQINACGISLNTTAPCCATSQSQPNEYVQASSALQFQASVAQGTAGRVDDFVTLEQHADNVVVNIGGKEFTVLHFGDALKKPYFWPVKAKDGAILTRPIDPNEKDHPHHKGVWLSVDEVNEIRFWAEKGAIATRNVTTTSGNPARIQLQNEWLNADGSPTLFEKTTISIYANCLVTYDVDLTRPAGTTVKFDDTKEGLFGFRVAQSMREKEGGTVFNSEGKKTTQECWGQPAKWVDYTGNVDGKSYGVTLMDHPNNFRPSRYHVRDYGLFSISPFGEGAYQNDKEKAKPVTLNDATPSLKIRYGLFIHEGVASEGELTKVYQQFVDTTK